MPKRVALTSLIPSATAALDPSAPSTPALDHDPDRDDLLDGATASSDRAVIGSSPTPQNASETTVRPDLTRTERGHRHYSELVRKETRLRDDQIDALATHARRLSRAKKGSDERITDNTLIRIAVDLLLRESPQLAGSTERQLRESVGL